MQLITSNCWKKEIQYIDTCEGAVCDQSRITRAAAVHLGTRGIIVLQYPLHSIKNPQMPT